MNISADIAIFFVGAFAAWFGAMVGGGGLVSIPFLIFMGLPPQVAIATNKFGGFGLLLGALARYIKKRQNPMEICTNFFNYGDFFLLLRSAITFKYR